MYGLYAYIDPPNHHNVGIYGIHGAFGLCLGSRMLRKAAMTFSTVKRGEIRVSERLLRTGLSKVLPKLDCCMYGRQTRIAEVASELACTGRGAGKPSVLGWPDMPC